MRKYCLLGLFLVAAAVSSCTGYSTQNVFRDDIKTVYVEFFDNETFRRGYEVALTRAVMDEIKLRTPLVIAPRNEADSMLSGELISFDEKTHVKTTTDQVLLSRVTVTVRFRWYDRLTGTNIVPEQTVEEWVRVAPELSGTIYDLAFQKLAERLVENMQQSW